MRVNRVEKVPVVLARLRHERGLELELVESKPYWKDRSLFEVRARRVTQEVGHEHATFHALQEASKLAVAWSVAAPSVYEGDRFEFRGVMEATTHAFSGIVFAEFLITNF
jgi:hypothetical protein